MSETESHHKATKRDVETFIVLGLFLVVFAFAVLIGSFWPMKPHARVVNIICGLIFLSIGSFAFWRASVTRRRMASEESES